MIPAEFHSRLTALERWRDTIDNERGVIMGDLGEIKGLLQGIAADLAERPSRAEMQGLQHSQKHSLRPKLTEMEVVGPWGVKIRLFGVSGIVILILGSFIVAAVTLVLLGRK